MSLSLNGICFLDWGPIDLQVDTGEIVCLQGESGSGKSLLLKAVADLVPNKGEARLGDMRREDLPAPDWRRQVGYLPSEVLWWEERVEDHFLRPPSKEQLERLGLPEDCLQWKCSRLSMGERQRLGLLRCLDRQPKALLLDEPTANLDAQSVERAEQLLRDYVEETGSPALWVTHNGEQARRLGGRVSRMEGKRLKMVEA